MSGDTAGTAVHDSGVACIFADTISCHGGSGVEVVGSNQVYVGLQRDGFTVSGNDIGATADGPQPATAMPGCVWRPTPIRSPSAAT